MMNGNALHRMSGPTVQTVLDMRDAHLHELDSIGTFIEIDLPPYAALDTIQAQPGKSHTVNVINNDHDANGHTLTLKSADSVSSSAVKLPPQATPLSITRQTIWLLDSSTTSTTRSRTPAVRLQRARCSHPTSYLCWLHRSSTVPSRTMSRSAEGIVPV